MNFNGDFFLAFSLEKKLKFQEKLGKNLQNTDLMTPFV